MSRLSSSKGGRIVVGMLGLGAALVSALIPKSQDYTSLYGYGSAKVTCGSVASRHVSATVDLNELGSYDSGSQYIDVDRDPIFEGRTATQVCDHELSGAKDFTIGAAVVGGLFLLIGLGTATRRRPQTFAPPPVTASPRPSLSSNPAWATPTGYATSGSTSFAAQPMSLPAPPPRQTTTGPVAFASGPASAPLLATMPPPLLRPAAVVPALPISYPVSLAVPASATGVPSVAAPMLVDVTTPFSAPMTRPIMYTVVFDNGDRVPLGRSLIVGRSPSPDGSGAIHAIADPLLSKTHLVIGLTDGQPWVEDRGSRNGTEIHAPATETIEAVAGNRIALTSDSSVSFGDSSFVLERH